MPAIKTIGRIMLGIAFIIAGLNHFWNPRMYRAIMPPYIPEPYLMVQLSGYAEILLGAMVFVPRWAVVTRWGLIALLIAVFPANLHMALHTEKYPQIPAWLLWARLPFQFLFAAWVYWAVTPKAQLPDTSPTP
jgi:uncharacterized membrane protein